MNPRLAPALVAAVIGISCGDPTRDAHVDELGPETTGIPPGPLHRAGQPCLTCHDGSFGSVREYSVAGTVYRTRDARVPAAGVVVELIDARSRRHVVATNCAGNFFVEPSTFDPDFPLWIALEIGSYRVEMDSPVRRDGSCATCHSDPAGPSSAGHVYLSALPNGPESSSCP